MKILVLSSFLPSAPSEPGSPRTFCFARELAKRHTLRLVLCAERKPSETSIQQLSQAGIFERIEIFPEPPSPSFLGRWLHRLVNGPAGWWELRAPAHVGTNRRRIAAYLKEWGADAIWVDGIAASQYVPPDKTALVDLCDSLGLLFQRQASFAKSPLEKLKLTQEGRAYRKWERKVAGRFPVVFISEIDRQTTGESVTVKTPVVIENGIDLDYFTFPPGERAAQQILFLGVLNYPPNADAAVYLAQEVFPLIREKAPEAELLIVGRSPGGEIQALDGKGGVTVFADVPDVRPFLLNSTVFICPLRFGAGVKNKILSAFAMKIPVVATSVALEGIAIEHRIHALFADSPEQLAESVVGLLSDRARADRMAAAGRAFVESRYSWTKSAEQFENALLNLPR